jgi:hypothetical protein
MVWPFSSSKRTPEETEKRDKLALEKEDETVSAASKDFRNRKLMEAINENCALESLALIDCQDSWSLWNRMTLCQSSQKNYMECLNMQRVLTPTVLRGVCCSCVTGLPCCWRLFCFGFLSSCVDVTVADGIWEGGKHGAR